MSESYNKVESTISKCIFFNTVDIFPNVLKTFIVLRENFIRTIQNFKRLRMISFILWKMELKQSGNERDKAEHSNLSTVTAPGPVHVVTITTVAVDNRYCTIIQLLKTHHCCILTIDAKSGKDL